jgi:hypothetical protein
MKNLNLNADFLLDIWADLKAKKLAPVAIGLVVVAVAIPALLMKGEETASEGPLPILASSANSGPKVEVSEELAERGSKLDSYRARDPFKGRLKPGDDDTAGSGTAIAPGDALGGGATDKGSSGTSGAPLGGLGSGGSDGSSGSSGPTGGSGLGGATDPGTTPTPPDPEIVKQKPSRFNYQLSLKFGRPGREERYPAVKRLTFLPKPSLPALLFMGVREDEKTAVFFVHPGLTHQGEGSCVPSAKQCNFLELKRGQQHYLSANDHEFRIELLKINRVRLSTEKKQRTAARKASSGRRSERSLGEAVEPGADADTSGAEDVVDFPWLVDGIG